MIEVIEEIQQRVLWLAVRMVDYANHDRPDAGGIKVGGHQASSASIVTIMTALWFVTSPATTRWPSNRMPRRCSTRSSTSPENSIGRI